VSPTDKPQVVCLCEDLHDMVVSAGLVPADAVADPWAALDAISAGPDLRYDAATLAPLVLADLTAVSNAYAQGRIDLDIAAKLLDLLKLALPIALAAI